MASAPAAPGLSVLLVLAGVLSAAAYTIVARGMGDESDPRTVTAGHFTTATLRPDGQPVKVGRHAVVWPLIWMVIRGPGPL